MAILHPFKSSTLEGAFLEAAFLLEKLETALNYKIIKSNELVKRQEAEAQANQKPVLPKPELLETKYIKITVDTDQQRCVIVATLPARIKENSFGGYLLAKEFFTDTAISQILPEDLEAVA